MTIMLLLAISQLCLGVIVNSLRDDLRRHEEVICDLANELERMRSRYD